MIVGKQAQAANGDSGNTVNMGRATELGNYSASARRLEGSLLAASRCT
jgi:hypothetical protein